MELLQYMLAQIWIFFILTLLYIVVKSINGNKRDWNFIPKKIWAGYKIRKWIRYEKSDGIVLNNDVEDPVLFEDADGFDSLTIWATDMESHSLYIKLNRRPKNTAEAVVILNLSDGSSLHLPNSSDTMLFNQTTSSWSCGDLKLIMLEPFRRWRIIFNGFMVRKNKNDTEINNDDVRHVRMNFIWIAASDPLRMPDDCSVHLLAEAVALEPWKSPEWMDGIKNYPVKGYDQCGNLTGIISIGDDLEPTSYSLVGFKKRRWGTSYSSFVKRLLSVSGATDDGIVYNVSVETNTIGLSKFITGFIRNCDTEFYPIEWSDIDPISLEHLRSPYKFSIKAKNKNFFVKILPKNEGSVTSRGGRPWDWEEKITQIKVYINDYEGHGILESWSYYDGDTLFDSIPEIERLTPVGLEEISINDICVSFSSKEARCSQFVGGKGSSLALLSSVETDDYQVPPGFCLTVKALEEFLRCNLSILNAIQKIEEVNCDYSEAKLKYCCERVCSLINETQLSSSLRLEVEKMFHETFTKDAGDIYYAVRSSGIGEDSEELSSAGQNASILGCKSLSDVLNAILKCWSSLFTFQSVEYRRQHGQKINCGMGVVVQRMINARSAGVMFTRHPMNGNPSSILITSNFGLGETVVSGIVEPDHIYIERDLADNLRIESVSIGSKKHKMGIGMSKDGETLTLENTSSDIWICSLTENECLSLAGIAVKQEYLWGSPRDIEWAISDGVIYLVQARPITSLQNWTEYELLHELDSPVMSNLDLMTFANCGEVLPGVLSPLSHSTMTTAIEEGLSIGNGVTHHKHVHSCFISTHYRMGLNIMNLILKFNDKKLALSNRIYDLAVYGHMVTDENMHRIAVHRNGWMGRIKTAMAMLDMSKRVWDKDSAALSAAAVAEAFEINMSDCKTSWDMYERIDGSYATMKELSLHHNKTTSANSFCQMIIFSILLEGKHEFSAENYMDIGMILSSSSNVISAEVPENLEKLARDIFDSGRSEEFTKINPDEGMTWLEENLPEVSKSFRQFLKKHGYRAIFEFDYITDTWETKPNSLIESLQTTLLSPLKIKSKPSPKTDFISNLASPTKFSTKRALKFFIPICQRSVSCRETTKAALVLCVHKFRLAYRKLAKQMMKEWLLPNERLIYYLTHSELGTYIKTRDPKLINKAMLRSRYFSKWNTYKFSEINWGVPKPINMDLEAVSKVNDNEKVLGTPVYPGKVTGRACVIHHLSEIDTLKSGDILITHSTDIGWSPYFPLLSGVVTELGGLISHGAVVAREYGLPCIVGTQNATMKFSTGDIVLLDSNKGFLQKSSNNNSDSDMKNCISSQ